MTDTPNLALLTSALGWIDGRKWGQKRHRVAHEVLARMAAEDATMVPISRDEFWSRIPGQHSHLATVLADLQARGVLRRRRGGGPVADSWGLSAGIYGWEVPWALSRSEVLLRLEAFSRPVRVHKGRASGPGAAPGQQGKSAAQGLPLDRFSGDLTRGYPWTASGALPDQGLPLDRTDSPPTVPIDPDDVVVRRGDDDDEAFVTLKFAIGQNSGASIWPGSAPEGALRRLAAGINGNLAQALDLIEAMGRASTRSPVVYVDALAELLTGGEERLAAVGAQKDRARLEVLNSGLRFAGEHWEQEAREIEARLARL